MKSVPDDKAGIGDHKHEEWKIPRDAEDIAPEAFPGDIKVNEATDDQGNKIDNKILIVEIVINKSDVHEDQHDIERAYEPHGASLFRVQIAEMNQDTIKNAIHDHREQQKSDQHPVLIASPQRRHGAGDPVIDDVVKSKQQKH